MPAFPSKLFSDLSSDLRQRPQAAAVLGLAVAGCVAGAVIVYGKGITITTKRRVWKRVGTVDKLYCFPLKSGKGKDCPALTFEELGPRAGPFQDRTFCLAMENE